MMLIGRASILQPGGYAICHMFIREEWKPEGTWVLDNLELLQRPDFDFQTSDKKQSNLFIGVSVNHSQTFS